MIKRITFNSKKKYSFFFPILQREKIAHARNRVWKYRVLRKGQEEEIFVKKNIFSEETALLQWEKEMLGLLAGTGVPVPELIFPVQSSFRKYLITKNKSGDKLYTKFREVDRSTLSSLCQCAFSMGEHLANIHSLQLTEKPRSPLPWDYPYPIHYDDELVNQVLYWLNCHIPKQKEMVLVHGDYHLSNVLFDRNKVSCILDWEWSGTGWKELDIAWTLTRRPHQKVFITQEEISSFIRGYLTLNSFDPQSLRWCIMSCTLFFYVTECAEQGATETAPIVSDYILNVKKDLLDYLNI